MEKDGIRRMMQKLKRRDFLKMVGLVVVCPTQLLGKSNVLSDSDWQAIHINISQAIKEKSRLFKITSREEAERIARKNLLFDRRIIKASDICSKTLSHYGCSLYSDCYNCSYNCVIVEE